MPSAHQENRSRKPFHQVRETGGGDPHLACKAPGGKDAVLSAEGNQSWQKGVLNITLKAAPAYRLKAVILFSPAPPFFSKSAGGN